jgi:6-pyruvoyltetrahydropterin/6-carboxytetrahydropterin synthase
MKAYFGRRYRLSASHRLHTPALTEAENREVFGKCANPHGHGHNYTVEVVVGGEIDAATGMVCDLVELDGTVAREVLEPFDHQNLNTLDAFRNRVPTTENLCMEIEGRLRRALRGDLSLKVRVEETGKNFFEGLTVQGKGTDLSG